MDETDARATLRLLLHRIAPEADLDAVGDGEQLQEALELDSMDFLNLMTALHEATGVDVPERDYPLVATVGGFVSYVTGAGA